MKQISIIIILVFLGSLLFQCSPKSENEIFLFNDIFYQLEEEESIEEITQNRVELYDSLFNRNKPQIPIFRSIKHQDYSLFIGIPYQASYEQILKTKSKQKDSLLISEVITDSCWFIKYRVKDSIAAEYLAKTKDSSLIYMAMLSINHSKADSLFSLNEFKNRISKK